MDLIKQMKQIETKLGFDCDNHRIFFIREGKTPGEWDLSIRETEERLEEGKRSEYETIEIQSNGNFFGSDEMKNVLK